MVPWTLARENGGNGRTWAHAAARRSQGGVPEHPRFFERAEGSRVPGHPVGVNASYPVTDAGVSHGAKKCRALHG
jgi:hypothetical protein